MKLQNLHEEDFMKQVFSSVGKAYFRTDATQAASGADPLTGADAGSRASNKGAGRFLSSGVPHKPRLRRFMGIYAPGIPY